MKSNTKKNKSANILRGDSKNNKKISGLGRISKPQKSSKHKKLKAVNALIDDCDVKVSRRPVVDNKQSNQKPNNADNDAVPRGIKDISRWKEKLKQGYKCKRKRKRRKQDDGQDNQMKRKEKGMTKPLKPVPIFKIKKGECEDAFMNRVERETQAVLQRSKFEDKYKVNLTASQNKMSDTPMKKKKGKRKTKQLQRLKEKKAVKMKKNIDKKKEKSGDFESLKDHVQFGEVVTEPPSLSVKPRKATQTGNAKPGKRELLLTKLMGKHEEKQRPVGKTMKRKEQSIAQQRILDAERDKVIQLYRQLKNKR